MKAAIQAADLVIYLSSQLVTRVWTGNKSQTIITCRQIQTIDTGVGGVLNIRGPKKKKVLPFPTSFRYHLDEIIIPPLAPHTSPQSFGYPRTLTDHLAATKFVFNPLQSLVANNFTFLSGYFKQVMGLTQSRTETRPQTEQKNHLSRSTRHTGKHTGRTTADFSAPLQVFPGNIATETERWCWTWLPGFSPWPLRAATGF